MGAPDTSIGFKSSSNATNAAQEYYALIRDNPELRDVAFRKYLNRRQGDGKLSIILQNWITQNQSADWARKQCYDFAEDIRRNRSKS
jgi:hypothetical protein